jgi:hypothetical protein
MHRLAVLLLGLFVALALLLSACGGDDTDNSIGPVASVELSVPVASLNLGEVEQVSAQPLDAERRAVNTATVTFNSSNPAIADVASSGALCAGAWDSRTAPVVCTPGPTGTSVLTATANGITSTQVTVFVHPRIDRISVDPVLNCIPVGQTQQLRARAFHGLDEISPDILGAFTWSSTNTAIFTVDANGLATAAAPGTAQVIALLTGVTSPAVTLTTCP